MTKKQSLSLPHTLLEAVKDKRAVLIFGAGASKECLNKAGQKPPDGNQMRDLLAEKFLGTQNETRDLMTVAEMAISNGVGEPQVFEEVSRMVSGFSPSAAHKSLAEFNWRGLATTNYDKLIEDAYGEVESRKQTCFPFVKDIEPYDDRLQEEPNSVALLKLHGCVDHRLDPDIPLVLSHEHYHRHKKNRAFLLQRLQGWAQSSVLIFIGYKLADSHIRALIYDIDPGKRPQWYIVSPNSDEHDKRFWASQNVDVVDATFGQFTRALEDNISPLFRSLSGAVHSENEPYQKHFLSKNSGSDLFKQSLANDIEYVHTGVSFDELTPKKFYSGHERGWCGVIRNYDFSRKAGERLLYAALNEEQDDKARFYLLQGSAGSGKTIALRKAALDAATAFDQMVFWLRPNGRPRVRFFEELYSLTGKRAVLFVDQISLYCDAIYDLLSRSNSGRFPITVIASEREADWGSYCQELENKFPPVVFSLKSLSAREAEDLVELLDRHKCLGMLEGKDKSEQIDSFMNKDRSDRQLLVALHELTLGKPFEQIILEEYNRILPEAAKRLYLDISTMHQFGVTARAGAISRISGIRFSDFEENFFEPLKDIVEITWDSYTGDRSYETRHPRVAQLVFGMACDNDREKASQLSRVISGLDAGFSSDARVIEGICKGRLIAKQFSDIVSAREIFREACEASPKSAFLFQQAAILEYTHSQGSLDEAEKLARTARELDGDNHIYIQTLAEIARRKANVVTARIKKERLRTQSRSFLNEIWLTNHVKDLTFCNLLVDEAVDLSNSLSNESKEHEIIEFDTKVDDAVERLNKASQDFPNISEFAGVEARLWERLGNNEKAIRALKTAIKARPRNSSVYMRLAKIERQNKSLDETLDALKKGLDKFPNDKALHLQTALALLEAEDHPTPDLEFHFRSSFGAGDHNFDGRFYYAVYLFWAGKLNECQELFMELDKRAPHEYRNAVPNTNDVLTSKLGIYNGSIESIKERFFFIRFGGYPNSIFSHWESLQNLDYDRLKVGDQVSFNLRFNRKGPVAVRVNSNRTTTTDD